MDEFIKNTTFILNHYGNQLFVNQAIEEFCKIKSILEKIEDEGISDELKRDLISEIAEVENMIMALRLIYKIDVNAVNRERVAKLESELDKIVN